MRTPLLHWTKALQLLVVLALAAGCGSSDSPLAANEEHSAPAQGEFYPALERAAKLPLPTGGISVSGLIGILGGTLTVTDYNDPGPEDDIIIDFNVDSGALTALTTITMTVLEDTTSGDLIMDFSPDGLSFSTDAEIDIRVGEDLVELDVDDITAWHEHDNTVDDATITSRSHSNSIVRVKVEVPGFSRYGMRRR